MMTEKPTNSKTKSQGYTALVYFHGIGEQRRYEDIGHLVDALEEYDHEKSRPGPQRLTDIRFEVEQPRANLTREVGYIRISCAAKGNSEPCPEFRLYDGYYANLIAGGVRPFEVLAWLLSLGLMPVKILLQPWRALSRLRRATLLSSWDRKAKKGFEPSEAERRLLATYKDFQRLEQVRKFGKGNFWQFTRFFNHDASLLNRRSMSGLLLTGKWLLGFVWVQIKILIFVLTFVLTLGLLIGGGLALMQQTPVLHLHPWLALLAWLSGFLILLVSIAISSFLRNYLGDLYLWTTYQETAEKNRKRRDILTYCTEYLSHVLLDEDCKRVVLVGHSMGTTVAHDAVLELARRNLVKPSRKDPWIEVPLYKIRHFITLGSVIDKVHYLFETVTSKSYHYNLVIDRMRGDLGTPPFSEHVPKTDTTPASQLPHIHWINFWDQADVASNALYTPTNHKYGRTHNNLVDNFEIASDCFPLPSTAHTNYLQCKQVRQTIFDVFFDNQHNFALDTSLIGSKAKGLVTTGIFHALAVLWPWMTLFGLLLWGSGLYISGRTMWIAFGSHLGLIVISGLADWLLRHRRTTTPVKTQPAETVASGA